MTDRIPPNQSLAAPGRWPVVGERAAGPAADPAAPWTITVDGLVAAPRSFTLDELGELPRERVVLDVHCVTRWSRLDVPFGGVRLAAVLEACGGPLPAARFVRFVARSERSHDTSLPLGDALSLGDTGVLVVTEADDRPLEAIHGGPVRTVTPGRYFYKSLKWVERIELLAADRLGWWEANAGYHNRADPWLEERYLAPDLDRRTVQRVLESREAADLDLRSLSAAGRDLRGLAARGAAMRDADLRGADLREADLREVNLSNAHLEAADLRGADLRGADVEGADFRGADLRGADLRVASMFGASFGPEGDAGADEGPGADPAARAARLDETTRIDPATLDGLTPAQRRWLPGG
jgi:DMSO/TMAO reductase YedYZ molybdopterin-dependent catalytic subunit